MRNFSSPASSLRQSAINSHSRESTHRSAQCRCSNALRHTYMGIHDSWLLNELVAYSSLSRRERRLTRRHPPAQLPIVTPAGRIGHSPQRFSGSIRWQAQHSFAQVEANQIFLVGKNLSGHSSLISLNHWRLSKNCLNHWSVCQSRSLSIPILSLSALKAVAALAFDAQWVHLNASMSGALS